MEKRNKKISIHVIYRPNGKVERSFVADAFQKSLGVGLEVESCRAVVNDQFLKEFF